MPAAVAERLALHEGGSAATHSTKINPVDITKTAIQLNSTGKQINTEAHRIERLPKLEHTTSIRRECPGTEKHDFYALREGGVGVFLTHKSRRPRLSGLGMNA